MPKDKKMWDNILTVINELQKLITQTYPQEKIVLFTQYSDTAKYLCKAIQEAPSHRTGR